jgi:hypothetical protein
VSGKDGKGVALRFLTSEFFIFLEIGCALNLHHNVVFSTELNKLFIPDYEVL